MSWDSGTDGGADWVTAPEAHPQAGQRPELSDAPVGWLWAGIGAAVIGLGIPFLSGSLGFSILGWILGGMVAVLLLAVFLQRDAERRATGWARSSGSSGPLRVALLAVATAAVVANAWVIADVLARRDW